MSEHTYAVVATVTVRQGAFYTRIPRAATVPAPTAAEARKAARALFAGEYRQKGLPVHGVSFISVARED